MAFRAHQSVLSYLDHREKDGYSTHKVLFHPCNKDMRPFPVLVYIATESNVEYLGPAPLDIIARQVAESRGPSGCNVEYVMNLARTMRETVPQARDAHLFDLERRLKEMLVSCSSEAGLTEGSAGHNLSLVCSNSSCVYHTPQQQATQST